MSSESFKGGVHYLAGALAFTMGAHALLMMAERQKVEPHVAFNAALYLLVLFPFEGYQGWRHASRSC